MKKSTEKQNQIVYYGKIKNDSGSIYVAATDKGLCFVGSFNEEVIELKKWIDKKLPGAKLIADEEKVTPYKRELTDYLNGERRSFDIPLDVRGTSFQETIWNELQNIPYGKTASYSRIASNIGKPKAVRAVGAAIGANPILIAIPCHRVIAKNGNLTGFRGGIPMKEKLLRLETNLE